MKRNLLKALLVTSIVAVGAFTLSLTSVKAESVYQQLSEEVDPITVTDPATFSLEEMLTYAIQEEYLAQAEYLAILETYGSIRIFENIVLAEQAHIDLLVTLFEAYGFVVPENTAASQVVIPESITSAFATAVEAETVTIAMYEAFLANPDLSEDVKEAFTYLLNASINHLNAFSKDRYSGLGKDMMQNMRNQFRKGDRNLNGEGNQYKGSRGKGGSNQGQTRQFVNLENNEGVCPNL